MQLGEGLGQRQAEPGALVFAVEVAVQLGERRQRLGYVGEGNANTRIDDLEDIATVHVAPDFDRHLAIPRRELDRVGQHVDHYLLELALIGMERRQVRRRVVRDVNARLFSPLLNQGKTR